MPRTPIPIHTSDHHAPHRHVGELIDILARAPLSEWVRERAIRAFELLGEAEGRIHGVPADAGRPARGRGDGCAGRRRGCDRGIRAAGHRPDLPSPGCGRQRLGARGARDDPGACARHCGAAGGPGDRHRTARSSAKRRLRPAPCCFACCRRGPRPRAGESWARGAWGAGGRDPEAYPNALRLIVAEAAGEAGDVAVLSTDLDDLSPEYLEPLREALFDGGRARRADVGDADEEGPDRVPGGGGSAPSGGRSGHRRPRPAQHDRGRASPDGAAVHRCPGASWKWTPAAGSTCESRCWTRRMGRG